MLHVDLVRHRAEAWAISGKFYTEFYFYKIYKLTHFGLLNMAFIIEVLRYFIM